MVSASRNGFTLIEILIAISIVTIMFTVSIYRFVEFNRVQTVKGVGAGIKNNLRAISAKALAGEKPETVQCDLTRPLVGYRVSFPTATTFVTQALCGTIANPLLSGPIITYTLSQGFSFNPLPAQFTFYGLGNGADRNTLLTIRGMTNPIYYYRLCVSAGGDIKDCGYRSGATPACTCP